MHGGEGVKRQITVRLRRLRRRADETAAEIAMLEQLLANMELLSTKSLVKLRKNSVGKWSFQSKIIVILEDVSVPLKAEYILDKLRKSDPSLKSSTFRSYIRRMAASGSILQSDRRGYYYVDRTE